jgi:hypothetical protein
MPRFQAGDKTKSIGFRLPIAVFTDLAAMAVKEQRAVNSMASILLAEALGARHKKAARPNRQIAVGER